MDSVAIVQQVGQALREAVEGTDLPASFRRLLYIPLRQGYKVLAETPQPRWPVLVLASCAAARGDERAGVRVAAAVELFMAALDAIDELEDDDYSPLVQEAGTAQALNVSTALLVLAQHLLAGLGEDGVPPERVPLFVRALAQAGLTASGGQHLDLTAEGREDVSTADALDIARRKAGAMVGVACRLGALLGTGDEEVLALYDAWGCHYGTAAQLANDLRDAENKGQKSDWQRAKGTLPLIYSRNSPTRGLESPIPQSLRASGALHFTWVVREIERQACAGVLEQLAARGQAVAPLCAILK